ncbi:hypothetical protein ACP275_04G219400 [Erythranthe tilingii]
MGADNEAELVTFPVSRNVGNNISMEISLAEASSLFPGFRFSPTDEELIQYYLKKKLLGFDEEVEVIPEVDICRHEPWDLPAQAVIESDNEWFFFSPRGRKYPNGSQSKRATEFGYWKATGRERGVKSGSNLIGTKRTLVFHTGRAPKGQRTEWIMHEYCTSEKSDDAMVVCRLRKNRDFHLNDDNARRNSPGDRDLDLAEVNLSGGGQIGMLEGAKECSSSYNSHSVEQVDNGSESDDKITKGSSESSHNKGYDKEEDCYADIMKDDIIKLDDDTSLIENAVPLRVVTLTPKSEMKSNQPSTEATVSSQGTANRRLRLRNQRVESYQPDNFEIHKFSTKDIPIEDSLDFGAQTRRVSLSLFVVLVVLILLILILFFTRDFWLKIIP